MSFTLPDWIAVVSLVASCLSLFLGWFSVKQANETAKRTEEINQYTQKALLDISTCTVKIETIVGNQQAQQMNLITKTNEKLFDFVTKVSNTAGTATDPVVDNKLPAMHEEHYY